MRHRSRFKDQTKKLVSATAFWIWGRPGPRNDAISAVSMSAKQELPTFTETSDGIRSYGRARRLHHLSSV